MNDEPNNPLAKAEPKLADQIGQKAVRKLQARKHGEPAVWLGLGMMGLLVWSIVVPTLLGTGDLKLAYAQFEELETYARFETADKLSDKDRKAIIELATKALVVFAPEAKGDTLTKTPNQGESKKPAKIH